MPSHQPVVPTDAYRTLIDQCLAQVRRPRGRPARRRQTNKQRGARDAAVIALAYTCGLAVGELQALQYSDYQATQALLHVPGVRRGGGGARALPLVGATREIVELWLALHTGGTYMFYPISFHGVGYKDQISQKGLSYALAVRARRALLLRRHGLTRRPSLRDLRSSFERLLKSGGFKDAVVRDVMGRASRAKRAPAPAALAAGRQEALSWLARRASPSQPVPRP